MVGCRRLVGMDVRVLAGSDGEDAWQGIPGQAGDYYIGITLPKTVTRGPAADRSRLLMQTGASGSPDAENLYPLPTLQVSLSLRFVPYIYCTMRERGRRPRVGVSLPVELNRLRFRPS